MLASVTANDGDIPPPDTPPADGAEDHPVADQPTIESPAALSDDATQVRPPTPKAGPSGTAVMPALPDDRPPAGAATPRWAGRAEVPMPPRLEEYPEPWTEPRRSVVIPVLLTVCVMLLLGVLVLGAWLILSNRPSPTPQPETSPSRTVTTAPTTVRTSPPTTAPATTEPALVPVPAVRGLDYATAEQQLKAAGLVPVRKDVANEAPAGTVLGTEPGSGTPLPPDSQVTVLVSLGPETSPTRPDPTST